jgi:hypothetical protein
MFTETLASEKRKGYYGLRSIELHGEDISTHFPREKFVLGLHNGGEIFGLAEHLVRRAVQQNDLDKVKQLLAENSTGLNFFNISKMFFFFRSGTLKTQHILQWYVRIVHNNQ